jgi:hypothetical protein
MKAAPIRSGFSFGLHRVGMQRGSVTSGITTKVRLLWLLKCAKVTITAAIPGEVPGFPMEGSQLSALDANIVAIPAVEVLPQSYPGSSCLASSPFEMTAGSAKGGSLRGLFWALMLETGVIILAIGVMMAWQVLRH